MRSFITPKLSNCPNSLALHNYFFAPNTGWRRITKVKSERVMRKQRVAELAKIYSTYSLIFLWPQQSLHLTAYIKLKIFLFIAFRWGNVVSSKICPFINEQLCGLEIFLWARNFHLLIILDVPRTKLEWLLHLTSVTVPFVNLIPDEMKTQRVKSHSQGTISHRW